MAINKSFLTTSKIGFVFRWRYKLVCWYVTWSSQQGSSPPVTWSSQQGTSPPVTWSSQQGASPPVTWSSQQGSSPPVTWITQQGPSPPVTCIIQQGLFLWHGSPNRASSYDMDHATGPFPSCYMDNPIGPLPVTLTTLQGTPLLW